jgi:2-phosphosulfolactate phosphatase
VDSPNGGGIHGSLYPVAESPLVQNGYAVRLEWGAEAVSALCSRCAVVIVVDVLSFSTSVDIVLGRGGTVRLTTEESSYQQRRPAALAEQPAGTQVLMTSPNGGRLCAMASALGTRVLTGCLRNARAVAAVAAGLADEQPIGVVAAGEQWGVDLLTDDKATAGTLRPAIEDQLGAGALVSELLKLGQSPASPEAALAATTYRAAAPYLGDLLAECASGRELIATGHGEDLKLAADVECSTVAPVLVGEEFRNGFQDPA